MRPRARSTDHQVMSLIYDHNRRRPLPLRGFLVNQGLTITELAERVGYAPETLIRVIGRQKPLSRDLALAIATELSLDLDQAQLLLGPPGEWVPGRRGWQPRMHVS
jgi:hypothetical protein